METRCILCGKELNEESNVCETCFNVLKSKYKNKKKLKQILQWHKNHSKELNKD
jgi:predicted nucleic acid-binding Zn ribbon protein